jgi:hypothetical protein
VEGSYSNATAAALVHLAFRCWAMMHFNSYGAQDAWGNG